MPITSLDTISSLYPKDSVAAFSPGLVDLVYGNASFTTATRIVVDPVGVGTRWQNRQFAIQFRGLHRPTPLQHLCCSGTIFSAPARDLLRSPFFFLRSVKDHLIACVSVDRAS